MTWAPKDARSGPALHVSPKVGECLWTKSMTARIGETTGETTGETGETTAEIVAAEPLRRKRCAGLPTSDCRPPQPIQVEVTNRAVTNRELPSADATHW